MNDLECSLSNVCYILYKNNINKNEKTFKVWMTILDDNFEVWMTILESGWNLGVWLVGVVSRRWVRLVGGIYGYGYHV